MSFLKSLIAVCVAVAALCAAAEAKVETVQPSDRGLVNVTKRACGSILWTSEAKWRGKPLDQARIKLLKVNDVITFPDRCMEEKPSKAVREATLRIFRHEEIVRREEQTQKANADLLSTLSAERVAADREFHRLKDENDGLIARVRRAEQAAEEAALRGRLQNIAIGIFVGAVMAFAGTWFISLRPLRKNNHLLAGKLATSEENLRELEAFRARILEEAAVGPCFSVIYHGERVDFRDTSERYAGCPHCPEVKLTPRHNNLRQHLDIHTRLRSVRRTPEYIKALPVLWNLPAQRSIISSRLAL